jgi:hypothetical protein
VCIGELVESGREVHTSTLGRADDGVGSSRLLDFAVPPTRPDRADYPIRLGTCAADVGELLRDTGMHPETVKIRVSSSRPPIRSFAYT